MAYGLAQLQSLSRQAGWPENLVEKAGSIWMYESGGIPTAHNPSGEDSWGLAQINWPYHKEYNRAQLTDPIYNLQAAYAIYRKEGWGAWYNSNRKYNNNYQGIAAQGRAIYAGAANEPIWVADSNTDFTPLPSTTLPDNTATLKTALLASPLALIGMALVAGLIIRNNE
jgi:hypothetical protein